MTDDKVFIDVNCQQKNIEGERICGDVFLSSKVREENRVVVVLSDGMGHGVKANVLATLTATMALNFTKEHKEPEKIAEIIMNTLPVCSERKMSYSTFTIIDINLNGQTTIIEYDNPRTIVMRGERLHELWWTPVVMKSEKNLGKEIQICSFSPQKEDRIILCSDGVTQSGMGTEKYPFGWGREKLIEYAIDQVKQNRAISARRLAARIVTIANKNDQYQAKDDTSCSLVIFRVRM